MPRMRILDESNYYWVWSAHGESDTGHYFDRTFVRGMIPCPLPGDIAAQMEGVGFSLTEYVPGEWFSHWEQPDFANFRQRPVFKPIIAGDQFPPDGLPDRLPDSWVEFFLKYTASGRLKKEHRGS